MEMISLGKMVPNYGDPVAVSAEDRKEKKSFPRVTVPFDMCEGLEFGSMGRFEMVVKVVGTSQREGGEPEAEIELHKAKFIGSAGKATKEEYSKMSDADREKHDKRMMDEGDTDEGEDE